jgi:transcriptional regulator GlxA family with amidase domain
MSFRSGSHTVFHHRYHSVWITKYRDTVLEGASRERIRTIIRPDRLPEADIRGFRSKHAHPWRGSAWLKTRDNPKSSMATRSRRIGVLIYPDCDIVDLCGPCDAFHYADYWLARFGRTNEPGYKCDILAATPGPVRTSCGIELVATHSFCEPVAAEQASKDSSLVEWVRSTAPKVRRVASVCNGAFILAAAGLLNHRRVTTHWLFSELLATAYPSIQVDSNLLFARDRNIYTSGGITAGIDLALALVEEDHGREIALATSRIMVVFPGAPAANPNSAPT